VSCVFIQEYAVRLGLPEFNPSNHLRFSGEVDGLAFGAPNTVQRHIKNTGDFNVQVRFNKLGLREDSDLSELGAKDFAVVGDSFSFGWGVAERARFSEQAEKLSKRKFYNASSPAGALDHYSRMVDFLRAQGATVNRVVVALNFETDVIPYQKTPKTETKVPEVVIDLQSIKTFLIKHSAAYFAATSIAQQIPWLRDIAERLGLIRKNLADRSKHNPDRGSIDQTVTRLGALAREADATVMVIPSRHIWFGSDRSKVVRVYERFIRQAKDAGINILDLRRAFEATGNPLSLHFKNDAHWTPEGHGLAAKALYRHLQNRYGDAF